MINRNLLFILLFALFLPASATGQGWERTYPYEAPNGAGSVEQAHFLNKTPDGGYILAGEVDLATGAIRHYVRLIKTDAGGQLQWEQVYQEGNILHKTVSGVSVLADGGYMLAVTDVLSLGSDMGLLRVNAFGDSLWTSDIVQGLARSLVAAPNGDFLLGGRTNLDFAINSPKLVRYSSTGELLWERVYSEFGEGVFFGLAPVSTGGYVATGRSEGQTLFCKLSEAGDIEWDITGSLPSNGGYDAIEASGGGFVIAAAYDGFAGYGPLMIKTDAQGNEEWTTYLTSGLGVPVAVEETPQGDFITTGSAGDFWSFWTGTTGFISKVDAAGTELWSKNIYNQPGTPSGADMVTLPGGGGVVAGVKANQAWLTRFDAAGNSLTNWIQGSVYRSTTCDTDDVISQMAGWTVRLHDDTDTLYTLTDPLGQFRFLVDTGNYAIRVMPPNALWTACDGDLPLDLPDFYDTTYVNLQVAAETIECPLLTVDISAPFLRRCFENTYTVQYCNEGSATALDAYVEVTLDPFLTLTSADLPFTDLGDNQYAFDIGDLPVNECGAFSFRAELDCDNTVLGQTHCTEAHIFPDTSCFDILPQAIIDIEPACEPDSVAFLLRNIGEADMQGAANFIVIEDDVMYSTQPFELDEGEERTVRFPANGATYRLETLRRPDFSDSKRISAVLEGCANDGFFSTGFVNLLPNYTGSSAIDLDCQENIGSYDPNDKQAFPTGYGDEHFIKPDTELEYLIRFQNTGTDTAFRVVIRDTLASWLDPASVRAGASSHPYSFSILGGGILEFVFDPIALPDSNVNVAGSIGFVRFAVTPKAATPLGAQIDNEAAIYFDFNPPVITNTVFHTIGEDFIISSNPTPPDGRAPVTIRVFPNPFVDQTTLEVSGPPLDAALLEWYNAQGQLVRRTVVNGNRLVVKAGALPGGCYYFRLMEQGRVLGSGVLLLNRE